MRPNLLAALVLLALAAGTAATAAEATEPGLVAHYFRDPVNWSGNWPDSLSEPRVSPADWTFRSYAYSRVEPVINHLFVNQGWFSVRWTGSIDTAAAGTEPGAETHTLSGEINLNPGNSPDNEFVLTLADGTAITRDDLRDGFAGYTGKATRIHLKPKGNASQNGLELDGTPFPLVNGRTYDITSDWMTVKLYNGQNGNAAGQWWLKVHAMEAIVTCDGAALDPRATTAVTAATPRTGHEQYVFEVWADDGCRLLLDGKVVLDDWQARWEETAPSLRRSAPVTLTPGKHRLVVEYFQGQSLRDGDRDPMKLYWSCPARGIPRQVVPPACLFHSRQDTTTPGR